MANSRHKQFGSAGQPTISVRAERTEQSLASEYTALRRRRITMIAVPALAFALLFGGLAYAYGPWSAPNLAPAAATPTAVAPTAATPALAAAAPTADVPTAVAPTAVPAVQPVVATNVLPSGIACPEIAGLPIYANATCIEHDADQDDGISRYENTYLTAAAANDVRLFFEGAFQQNNWTISESEVSSKGDDWEYTIIQDQRRLRIDIEAEHENGAPMTKFAIEEMSPLATIQLPAANGSIACPEIAAMPLFASATCIKHNSDTDNGILKHENTYITNAAADDVRLFYEGSFGHNGWSIAESKHDAEDTSWSYELTQAQRRVEVEIKPRQEAAGIVTRIVIDEK